MKAKTKEELLELYKVKHGNFYNYSFMDLNNKINGKIKIICPIHGEFLQHHYDHISAGCPTCGNVRKKINQSKILINNLEDLEKKYGDKFDFSKSNYKNSSSTLIVRCKEHNQYFKNTTYHIVRGAGCSTCKKEKISSKKKLGRQIFIDRSISIHNEKYDYSLVSYNTLIDPVEIICKKHGIFKQKPREHIRGHGCPQCASTTISYISQQWLNTFNICLEKEYKILHETGYFIVDGYDSSTNTVYEFYGDYWHGNPKIFNLESINPSVDKTFGELYYNTLLREQVLKNMGYKLITIWESEFHDKSTR